MSDRYSVIFILICILTIFSVINAGCRGKKGDQKATSDIQSHLTDSTYIFNGVNLEGCEVTNFGPQGPVTVSGGEIILGMGDGLTGITYKRKFPEINYEVTLEAMRVAGNDIFCGLTFPVGSDPCTLIVGGWGGTVVGLSSIDGKDASENETTRYMNFEKSRWYSVRLKVTVKKIEAWIDDEKVIDILINGKRLSVRSEVGLSRPFGIASWCTTAALRNIKVISVQP
ncbi:MAG: DUF1080 domain-containing protein [Bacteroidales bacterium]|nr:DUF1080 domain-containing protein [Bacteroidales bacterium]